MQGARPTPSSFAMDVMLDSGLGSMSLDSAWIPNSFYELPTEGPVPTHDDARVGRSEPCCKKSRRPKKSAQAELVRFRIPDHSRALVVVTRTIRLVHVRLAVGQPRPLVLSSRVNLREVRYFALAALLVAGTTLISKLFAHTPQRKPGDPACIPLPSVPAAREPDGAAPRSRLQVPACHPQ